MKKYSGVIQMVDYLERAVDNMELINDLFGKIDDDLQAEIKATLPYGKESEKYVRIKAGRDRMQMIQEDFERIACELEDEL